MNTLPGISVYNQDRLSDEDFVANFVARRSELAQLTDELRAMARGGDTRHAVVVGTRGMGKSTMLRRIAIAVRRDSELDAAFMALSFREEQYNVISLDAFWRNCGEALAEWCEQTDRHDMADELDRAVASADWRDDEKSEKGFLTYCRSIGRRPLLLLDNLDIILDGLKEKESWALRRALQAKNGPVVIGGATKLLAQGADRNAPFYEFFYPHFLEPLTEAEVLACMHALANRREDAGARVKSLLAREPERVRTLYALTGGNPRVLALIYQVLERAETDSIFADLEALLDQVTPFYKARIEEYQTPQQRAVIDAIALNWDPIGSRALADATGIEITTVSSQLNRLRKDGIVEEVESSGARASYQLAERFLNIWYLMRHGTRRTRQRLRWLTLFLVRLFSADDLRGMAAVARDGGRTCKWHRDYREAVLAAAEMIDHGAEPIGAAAAGSGAHDGDHEEFGPWSEHLERADELYKRRQYTDALATLEQAIPLILASGESTPQIAAARALYNKGVVLGHLGRNDEALATNNEFVTRYGKSDAPALQERVASALVNNGVLLYQLGRSEEAVAVFNEIVERYGSTETPRLRDMVAKAIVGKGITLAGLGQAEEALEAYNQVVLRYGGSEAPMLLETVATARLNKGAVLGEMGQAQEALKIFDEIVNRHSGSSDPETQLLVVDALMNKAIALKRLGRAEEAVAIYEEIVNRYGKFQTDELRHRIVRAQSHKGGALMQLGKLEQALSAFGRVLAQFGSSNSPVDQEWVARALLGKSVVLRQLGKIEEALAADEERISRYFDSESPELQQMALGALVSKGNYLLDRVGDPMGAEVIYRKGLSGRSLDSDLVLQANIAWALLAQGKLDQVVELRRGLEDLQAVGKDLIDAAIQSSQDNLGLALEKLASALALDLKTDGADFFDDLLRLLRLAVQRGHGERLIEWFEQTGNHDKYAPVYAALVAYQRGKRFLLDFNPEVRATARRFFDFLSAPDKAKETTKRAGRRRKVP